MGAYSQSGSSVGVGSVVFQNKSFTMTVEMVNGRRSLVVRGPDTTTRQPIVFEIGLLNVRPMVGSPSNPQDGDIWYDDTTGLFNFREEGVTMSLSGTDAPVDATYVVASANAELTAELVLGTDVIMRGTFAARPAAGTAGRIYISTDTTQVFRDNGASWDDIIVPAHSIIQDATGLRLSGDAAAPGANQVYGTGAGGTKGWKADPSGGHTIRENGVDQTTRTGLNFIDTSAGAGLITDDAGGNETEVNLTLYLLATGARAITGAIQTANLEVGHATDTTLARAAAGQLQVEGVNLVRQVAGAVTDNRLARMDGTTGDLIQQSVILVDDSGNTSAMGTLGCGAITSTADVAGTTMTPSGDALATPVANRIYKDTLCNIWARVDGTAAPASILDDYNTASVTDNGVGDWTLNAATAWGASSFVMFTGNVDSSGSGAVCALNSSSTSTLRFTFRIAGTLTDSGAANAGGMGAW